MQLQDYFPANETILGLDNIFTRNVDGFTFYVNSPCVIASNQQITKYETYLLISDPKGCKINLSDVILIDVYYFDGFIHLIVMDKNTQMTNTLRHKMDSKEAKVEWRLVDINYCIKNILNELRTR